MLPEIINLDERMKTKLNKVQAMLFDRVEDLTYEDLLDVENIIDKVTKEANDNINATADFSPLLNQGGMECEAYLLTREYAPLPTLPQLYWRCC